MPDASQANTLAQQAASSIDAAAGHIDSGPADAEGNTLHEYLDGNIRLAIEAVCQAVTDLAEAVTTLAGAVVELQAAPEPPGPPPAL